MGVVGPRTGLDAINTLCIERYSEDIMRRPRCTKLIVTIAFHKAILALRVFQVDIKLWTVMSHAIAAYRVSICMQSRKRNRSGHRHLTSHKTS